MNSKQSTAKVNTKVHDTALKPRAWTNKATGMRFGPFTDFCSLFSRDLLFTVCCVLLAVFCLSAACASSQQPGIPTPPQPKTISTAELAKLRWIEGSWRGTGDVDKPFFERYRFENDSTLVTESFADETFSKVTETSVFSLKDGHFGNEGEGSRWVATALDEKSITFAPVVKARNSFRFERESDNVWIATLNWPATDKAPANQHVYRMERIKRQQ